MLKIVGVGKSHFADYVKSISSPDIEMEQITPHVYSFPGIRGCDPSMVLTSQGAVFIDTAQWITQLEQMIDFAKEKCGGVKYVINTESHIDHVFGNPYLKREGATIISHEKMVDGYYKIPPAFNQTTYEYNLDLLKRQDPTQVAKLLPEGEEEIGKPDITFSDRMTLKLGDHTFQIFHTPGHSPEQSSVYVPQERCVFVGDNIFNATAWTGCRVWMWTTSSPATAPSRARSALWRTSSSCTPGWLPWARASKRAGVKRSAWSVSASRTAASWTSASRSAWNTSRPTTSASAMTTSCVRPNCER